MNENEIGTLILEAAITLHKKLGPGLMENVYELSLFELLVQKGLHVQRQVPIPIEIEGKYFDKGFRADLLVEGKVLVELKSVAEIIIRHKKQLLTYMKLANIKLGYILNFGAPLMRDGIVRLVHAEDAEGHRDTMI